MLAILVVLPLIFAAFLSLVMKRNSKAIRYIALIASLISLILIVIVNSNPIKLQSINWFTFSGFSFVISTSTMPLNTLLLFIVGIITPLIIIYSIGFMNVPSEQPRYYFELCLFAASMMLFAIAADFITMLIGWELLGVTSYLLIGFWYAHEGAADAARKAITTILIGDVLMFAAMLIIWNSYHTFSFAAIIAQSSIHNLSIQFALVLVIIAIFTKSAQFPFNEWLADAMKGPTPVSAFLHSSTMVKAGVFLAIVLFPLFAAYNLLYLFLIFGLITTIIGVTNALTEPYVKRILAFSTMEDLGLMFIALGTGSILAAMILFIAQTFYKALIFMSAGSIMKANNDEEKLDRLSLSPSSLQILIPTIIGVASLAGLFPLSGFFGKAAIELSVNNIILYSSLLIIAFFSNIYIFRWLFVPLQKKSERRRVAAETNYRTMPKSMIIPLYILAALVVLASVSYLYLPSYLIQYTSQVLVIKNTEIIISSLIFLAALLISYSLFYGRKYSTLDENSPIYKILYNNLAINSFYLHFTGLIDNISKMIDSFDYSFYKFVRESINGVNRFADLLKKLEDGNVNTYLIVFIIGLIAIVLLFVL